MLLPCLLAVGQAAALAELAIAICWVGLVVAFALGVCRGRASVFTGYYVDCCRSVAGKGTDGASQMVHGWRAAGDVEFVVFQICGFLPAAVAAKRARCGTGYSDAAGYFLLYFPGRGLSGVALPQ